MKTFREFFKERHNMEYPALPEENPHIVFRRTMDTMADYMDYVATQTTKKVLEKIEDKRKRNPP